jgi:TnpA family transposase
LAAGEINARYGHDPGLSLYTHLSDQHGPYNIKVMSATHHEAPYVLDGLLHHGTLLKIETHYTDTGGASDHVFALCALLGFRFCPRLRDLPERKLACIAPVSTYPHEALAGVYWPASGARRRRSKLRTTSPRSGHASPLPSPAKRRARPANPGGSARSFFE